MISKPEQPDEISAVEYLSTVSERVIQSRKDINEAWQISDEEEIDKIASDERDRVADAFVDLLAAWKDIFNKDFSAAIGKAAIAESLATKASLRVWDELAASVYDDSVRGLGGKFRITVANLTQAARLKIEGEKKRRSAVILYEQDDYTAVEKYRESVTLLRKSKEEAKIARSGVGGQTLQAWVKIALYLLTIILTATSIIVTVRSLGTKSNQIPNTTKTTSEIDEPNLTK